MIGGDWIDGERSILQKVIHICLCWDNSVWPNEEPAIQKITSLVNATQIEHIDKVGDPRDTLIFV